MKRVCRKFSFLLVLLYSSSCMSWASMRSVTPISSHKEVKRSVCTYKKLTAKAFKNTDNALKSLIKDETKLIREDTLFALGCADGKTFRSIRDNYQTTYAKLQLQKSTSKDSLNRKQKRERTYRMNLFNIQIYEERERITTNVLKEIESHKNLLIRSSNTKRNKRSKKLLTSIDKTSFYTKQQCNYNKRTALRHIKTGLKKEILKNAKSNNLLYAKQIAEARKSFEESPIGELQRIDTSQSVTAMAKTAFAPAEQQLKNKVRKSMPQNAQGTSPQNKAKLNDQMQKSMSEFDKMKTAAIDPQSLLDTITFKPNPYKILPLRKRIRPGINWQFHAPSGYTPAKTDIAFSLGYLLSPRVTPSISVVYALGLGHSFNSISLSHQGYGLRTGAEYKLRGTIIAFGSYEGNWVKNNAEARKPFLFSTSAIFGIGIKSGGKRVTKMMFGYDVMYHFSQTIKSPFVIRLGIE